MVTTFDALLCALSIIHTFLHNKYCILHCYTQGEVSLDFEIGNEKVSLPMQVNECFLVPIIMFALFDAVSACLLSLKPSSTLSPRSFSQPFVSNFTWVPFSFISKANF